VSIRLWVAVDVALAVLFLWRHFRLVPWRGARLAALVGLGVTWVGVFVGQWVRGRGGALPWMIYGDVLLCALILMTVGAPAIRAGILAHMEGRPQERLPELVVGRVVLAAVASVVVLVALERLLGLF
jgi:hypothetical protein